MKYCANNKGTYALSAFLLIVAASFINLIWHYNSVNNTNAHQLWPDLFFNKFRYGLDLIDIFVETKNKKNLESIESNNRSRFLLSTNACDDSIWCNIPMPKKSLFRFESAPTDINKWNKAKLVAAAGTPLLIQKALKVFPHYLDFLDGDASFRIYHLPGDIFIDNNFGLEMLSEDFDFERKCLNSTNANSRKRSYPWEKDGHARVIPEPYDIRDINRAPVVHFGYFAFNRDGNQHASDYFWGKQLGEAIVDKGKFIDLWVDAKAKGYIKRPWIALHSANENWGMLSTYMPNRTIDWGSCCSSKKDQNVLKMLNDEYTVMLLTNQHHNLTHPKLVSLPRGLPITSDHNRRLVWDTMRETAKKGKKKRFIFTSSSSWGYRPNILQCLANKFSSEEMKFSLYGERDDQKKSRLSQRQYYNAIASSMFTIALPGLGYDTFRLWEALTMGSIPILEKGTGLDKPLWRLPALLVDDFDEVTPSLLRQAYVEALYRAEEFEFERLTQSFWWTFIMNVSVAGTTQAILDKFPLESEDPGFTRPLERFSCNPPHKCSPGTKRTPRSYC